MWFSIALRLGMSYALPMKRDLWNYEINARDQGYQFIAGVDEAGRGPLAGPGGCRSCSIASGCES